MYLNQKHYLKQRMYLPLSSSGLGPCIFYITLHHPYIQEETRPSRWGYPNGLQMMKMTKKISPLTSVYHHHHHHHKARSPRIELFWTEYCASGLTTISNIYQRSHYNYLLPLPLLEDPVEYIYDALCLIYTVLSTVIMLLVI